MGNIAPLVIAGPAGHSLGHITGQEGNVRNPQSLVQYTYVLNNPLMYVDPLGMWTVALGPEVSAAFLLKLDFNVQLAFDGDGNLFHEYSVDISAYPNCSPNILKYLLWNYHIPTYIS